MLPGPDASERAESSAWDACFASPDERPAALRLGRSVEVRLDIFRTFTPGFEQTTNDQGSPALNFMVGSGPACHNGTFVLTDGFSWTYVTFWEHLGSKITNSAVSRSLDRGLRQDSGAGVASTSTAAAQGRRRRLFGGRRLRS